MADYAVQWVTMDGAAIVTRVSGGTVRNNNEISSDQSASIYPETMSLTGQLPDGEFATSAIKTILDNVSLAGECVGSAHDIADLKFIARAISTCKDPNGATPHYQLSSSSGLLLPQRLGMSRVDDAEISCFYHAFTPDGSNHPFAETDGVATPSGAVNERYRLGAAGIAGQLFDEIDNIEIDFGINITDKTPQLATLWPETAGVSLIASIVTITGRDLAKVKAAAIPLTGAAASHINTKFQLVRIEDGASFYSQGASQHISLTAAGLVVPETLMTGGARQRASNTLQLACKHDGSNVPIVVSSTAVAYDPTPQS